MKVLVFAKQIPDVNQVSFDPRTNRIVRENVPLLFNSFDKKAVEEAIRLKEKHGFEVSVASMGPPQAKEILNDALRMGADRAYLITDRAFAGSDTLVTSRVLSEFTQQLKPDIVLTGKYSLDGETSQVPPEVAVLSGYHFKSSVSRIDVEENMQSCIVEHENEQGLTKYRVPLPAVFSVSEKINRARAIPEDAPQMYDRIEAVDSSKIGREIVGDRDSPTVVTGTRKIESERKAEFIPYDADVFRRVIEIVSREVSHEGSDNKISLPDFDMEKGSIFGVALDDPRASMEMAAKAADLASTDGLNVLVVGNIDPGKLEGMSCHKYYFVNEAETDVLSKVLSMFIQEKKPENVIYPSTTGGRELSAMVAARLGLGLTADCIDLKIENGGLVQYKPAFGGGIVASIVSRTKPGMATARPGMFPLRKSDRGYEVESVKPEFEPENEKLSFEPVPSEYRSLNDSNTVLGIGRGLKSRNSVKPVLELADRINASVGGTRPVVDMRWMPRQQQIGLTGMSISPDTYIALGISGQDNHVVGIRYAGKIIAVNNDRNSPVFKYADYGIVADANEFVAGFSKFLDSR